MAIWSPVWRELWPLVGCVWSAGCFILFFVCCVESDSLCTFLQILSMFLLCCKIFIGLIDLEYFWVHCVTSDWLLRASDAVKYLKRLVACK